MANTERFRDKEGGIFKKLQIEYCGYKVGGDEKARERSRGQEF